MIKKETLAQIILDFQNNKLPNNLTERDLKINLDIPLQRAVSIVGPRRSGKTYYFYNIINKLISKGIEKHRILYVNFENIKLVDMELKDLDTLLNIFYEIYPQNINKKIWLFFDEIQNIKNWEIFVRSILDNNKVNIFLTGSSSKLLSREIATSLRGRTLNYFMFPFSFAEFLKIKRIQYIKYLSSQEKIKIINAFNNYLTFGGYPETIIYPSEKEKIINEIIEVTIYQDLIERYKIRNTKIIKLMFNSLIESKEFSVHKFYNFLKSLNIKISKNSLYNYLEYFNDAFIFFPLRRFDWSLKKIEQSRPKIYCIDNGLIENIVGNNKGKKFENLTFLSLLRKNYELNKNIFYYSLESGEVDFVVKERKRIVMLIQACIDIDNYKTKEREAKSLIKASEELKCNNLLILTGDYEGEEKMKNKKIKYIPLWKWLLNETKVTPFR